VPTIFSLDCVWSHEGSNSNNVFLILLSSLADTTGAIQQLHVLLKHLWLHDWQTTHTWQLVDPTERFVVLCGLSVDGGWKQARHMTPVFARVQYCIRSMLAHELHLYPSVSAHSDLPYEVYLF
jgi:hypothetical protein